MAIYQKLLEYQKLGITITKDAENPHYRSKYASLNEVLAKVKGPLNDMGVVIVQRPWVRTEPAAYALPDVQGLLTELVDTEDGSKVECFIPFIGASDMQKLGGAVSYARRYSLVALLGLEDEDDDAESVVGAKTAAASPKKAAYPTGPTKTAFDEPFKGDEFAKGEDLGDLSISFD
jgi:hypothetical protein